MSLEIVLFSFTNFQPPWSVADPWEGSRGACPPHPLIFRPNWGPKGWKNFFSRPPHTPPLFFLRVWMTRLPLTWRSGSATVSSETQGQIVGARIKYGTKKSKERREGPLGTMSCQTSSRLSPPFWLLIGARKTHVFWHQSEARTVATVWNWSGKTLSPGALLAVLYFSSCHIYFSARLDFPSTLYLPLGLRGWKHTKAELIIVMIIVKVHSLLVK